MKYLGVASLLATVALVTCQQHTSRPPPTVAPLSQEPQTTGAISEQLNTCTTGWSAWINRDTPETDGGEYERMTSAEQASFCPGGLVQRIECQTVPGTASNSSVDHLKAYCTVLGGFSCNNTDNAPVLCSDFEIRYRCNCPAVPVTVPVVTTDATTPAQPAVTTVSLPTLPPATDASAVPSAATIAPLVTDAPSTVEAVTTPQLAPTAAETSTPAEGNATTVATNSTAEPSTAGPVAATSTGAPNATAPSEVTSAATPADNPTTATAAPANTTRPRPESFYPSLDEIVSAFKQLTETNYFRRLNYQDQILLLELTSGGQVGQIQEILDTHGWERVLSFMYSMPFNHFDTLMRFVLVSLEKERLINGAS